MTSIATSLTQPRAYALRVLAIAFFLLASALELRAATLTLKWNANPEPNIAGYIVSYGTQSRTYSSRVDVGNLTSWIVNLDPGRYYFALQAYNTSAQQSAMSAEVVANIANPNGGGVVVSVPSAAGATTGPIAVTNGVASTGAALVKRLPLSDYDGDGRSDIALYQPSTGAWQVLKSSDNSSPTTVAVMGTATDLPVPGDYDADRKTDPAYYRPSTGRWSILKSSTNYATRLEVFLGTATDVPVPGDYDGDGATDMAVYSPATGQWSILKSSTNYLTVTTMRWGSGSDVPVPGDYDGDGKTDLAVYQPSTGQWRILQSSTDYATNVTLVLGMADDIPVSSDYDGDGISDVAVFRPSTGMWLARLSSGGFEQVALGRLGASAAVPVPGDYDGDGKADLAVFVDGTWQVLYSHLNYTSGLSLSWGRGTDIAVAGRP